jgi:APA family basic amino acid/polyamine antiporter
MEQPVSRSLVRGLGVVAATSITVAGVIGTGVFLKARVMTCNVETPGLVLLAWVVAGALSIAGSLTYAELGAMMPEAGGEYAFMRAAYGRFWAFVFGWMRFFIAGAGGAAALAAGLAIFTNVVAGGALAAAHVSLGALTINGVTMAAMAAIVVVTLINCAAVAVGGRIASTMAVAKIVLIAGLGVTAFALGGGTWAHFTQSGALGVCEGVPAASPDLARRCSRRSGRTTAGTRRATSPAK